MAGRRRRARRPGTTISSFSSELGGANGALKLDIYRLMRAAGAMQNERDYIELGQAAGEARLIGEVKAVYQEGLSRNLITTNAAFARERLQAAAGRAADDRASLAGERTAALAGSDGAAALRLGDAYFGYGDMPGGRRALPRGAAGRAASTPPRPTRGSARRSRWPASGPRPRRRSGR